MKDDLDYDNEPEELPPAPAGDEWDECCDTCRFYREAVFVEQDSQTGDGIWQGYCLADNNPMDPHEVYNSSPKCEWHWKKGETKTCPHCQKPITETGDWAVVGGPKGNRILHYNCAKAEGCVE